MNPGKQPDAAVSTPLASGLRCLVTGAGGFLGRAIAERLLARGDRVRSLSRGAHLELDELGVEALRGDVADAAAARAACHGCDIVFHTAARLGMTGPYHDFYETN